MLVNILKLSTLLEARINSSVKHKMVIHIENVNSQLYNTENFLGVIVSVIFLDSKTHIEVRILENKGSFENEDFR